MRRADRLFQIVQHFRGGRLVTAQKLGQWLEVSERTIYRDIADLQSTGVPIDGEAGVGYIMREVFDLPPLMFTRDEIVALVAGARMVMAFGGATMARAADEALVKIGAVLPDAEKDRIARTEIHTPMWVVSDADRKAIDILERSVEKRDVLTLDYRDEAGRTTARDVRPLGLWFWGKVWTLVAWCEMRDDFRAFRIDRISAIPPPAAPSATNAASNSRTFIGGWRGMSMTGAGRGRLGREGGLLLRRGIFGLYSIEIIEGQCFCSTCTLAVGIKSSSFPSLKSPLSDKFAVFSF